MKKMLLGLLVSLAFVASTSAIENLNPDKPFAERHVLLQVSDNDPAKFQLVLSIANNLIRHYGSTDSVDIQVVTFAGGVQLLKAGSQFDERIESLMASDVRFYVCLNTLDTLERHSGKRMPVIPGAVEVRSGVAYMLDQIELGYPHIHP